MAQIKEDVKRCNIFIDLLNMDQIIVYKLCLDFMSFSTSLLLKKAASHTLFSICDAFFWCGPPNYFLLQRI